MMLEFKLAHPGDGFFLNRIAQESKAIWGYSSEYLKNWEQGMKVDEQYIKNNIVYKIYFDQELIGFYALCYKNLENCFEVDHLWLIPAYVNKGIGRTVFIRILSHLKELGQTRALLKGDPHARGFYEKMLGKLVPDTQDSGTDIPVYEFDVSAVLAMTAVEHS